MNQAKGFSVHDGDIALSNDAPSKQDDLSAGLELLLSVMPPRIREAIESKDEHRQLIEVVLDLGRAPEARFPNRMEELTQEPVSREDINHVVARVGRFGDDNRTGIERTLHRISAIRNRAGAVIGLTCRVGRAVFGTIDIVRDVIEAGESLLLLGRPGVGKTTLLREAARVIADELHKRVIIVDTSNEIGGDGDIPHPGIGRARRMQVPSPERQHAVMIEAVENHMPQVIVIDEIGTTAEAMAARTIAERGVQLIATAHGNTLENLLQNPTLSDLVGGIQSVTLSDEEARRRGTQKTVLERKAPPTFNVLIEIQEKDRLAVHHDVSEVVDNFLRGMYLEPELRVRTEDGRVEIRKAEVSAESLRPVGRQGAARGRFDKKPANAAVQAIKAKRQRRRTVRIFPYGVSRIRLEQTIEKFRAPAVVIDDVDKADMVLALKSQEKRQPRRLREAEARGVPLYIIKSNTVTQMENFLRSVFDLGEHFDSEEAALREAEAAISEVREEGLPVELSPQNNVIRKLQHQLADKNGLNTESKGREPYRRVVIYPV
jgi:stage III sporulation protein SpoIIIAA